MAEKAPLVDAKKDEPKEPETRLAPRKLTDPLFLLVFAVAVGGYVYVLQYAWANHNRETLSEVYMKSHEIVEEDYTDLLSEYATVGATTVFAVPTCLIVPVVHMLGLVISMFGMLSGLCILLTCGDARQYSGPDVSSVLTSGNIAMSAAEEAARALGISYTAEQKIYIAYYLVMMLWVAEICAAVAQFVLAYVVILWYYTPYKDGKKAGVPSMSVMRGYCTMLRYHFGTICFGSFLLAMLRAVRIVLETIAKSNKEQNPALACLARVIGCIVDCFTKFIEFINKNAYMDVAMNSSSYCVAAKNALGVISSAAGAIALLNGAMGVLVIVGVCLVAGLTGICGMLLYDHGSYAGTREGAFVGTAVVGALIGYVFMNVFDMVCDTMIYCYATDEKTGSHTPAETKEGASAAASGRFFACCGAAKDKAKEAIDKVQGKPPPPEHTPPELKQLLSSHK
eukprot:TRINITY_DN27445_c0_g1_i1.p1 TRINITY_DN27445_c0_g1~~TRINITY_DN27445_c0_g1_i1.p1  ORF type:complete len:453 (-),score=93.35 TRINITY_DN27445_c0_g1_i1:349-1707(-)